MKKILFVVLLSTVVMYSSRTHATTQQAQASAIVAPEHNEFDSFADDMVAQGMASSVEVKEPSSFQLFLRRVGGPIVMSYVRMREKMTQFWAWMTTKRKTRSA